MRSVLAAVAVIAVAPVVARADRVVTGSVVADATGAPVVGALVVIGNGEATTDAEGRFRIRAVPAGRADVVVVADGYAVYVGAVRDRAWLVIRLVAASGSQELIRIDDHAPIAPPLRLDTEAIRTQPGAGNDVLRALQSMPGVARTPFGLGGLALRGTAPRDTKVFLDGIEVPLLYHFGGVASFMPTGAIADVSLEPSGASAAYGRALGGVATVTSRRGRRDRWRVGGELSLIHAAALGEGPGPLDGSWLVGVRRSYFDALIRATGVDLALLPRYLDAQVRWESGDGRWMAIAFGSDDKLALATDPDDPSSGFDTPNVKSFGYRSRFARAALRYRDHRGATSLELLPSIGIDDVNARANHDDLDKGLHRITIPLTVRATVTTPAARGVLTVGVDGGWQHHDYDLVNTPPATPMDPTPSGVVHRALSRWSPDLGGWMEEAWTPADVVEIRAGLRGDYFGLSEQWTLDPRLLVNLHLPHDVTLTTTAGRYHAPPLVTDLDPIFGARIMLGSRSTQVATAAKKLIGDHHEVSASLYYQRLGELPVDAITGATPTSANGSTESGGLLGVSRELVDSQFGSYTYREAIGTGRAYGLELIARRTAGTLTGWVAYTYARSLRTNPVRGDGEHPYVLDQPHALTAVGSAQLGRRWRLGARFRITTGNPLTPVAGAFREDDGDWVPVDGPILSQRLPGFYQLDVRLDRSWRRPWGTLNLYIDVQNAVNHRNVEGVTYNRDFSRQSYTTGLPIFPSIGVELIP